MTEASGLAVGRQPWLHDLDITVDGPVTVVCARDGDIGAPGTGVMADDRRVVSVVRLRLDGEAATPVVASAVGGVSEHWLAARHLGDDGPDPTVEVLRRRSIDGPMVVETITITSRAATPVSTTIELALAGDGAELATIKLGRPTPLGLTAAPGESVGWRDDRHATSITVTPPPAATRPGAGGGVVMTWPVRLTAGAAQTIAVTTSVSRRMPTNFDADPGSDGADWEPDDLAASATDPRLAELVRVGLTDLRHLLLRDPLAPDDIVAAAGSPWYLTLFGRDALWAARFMVRRSPALAAGTLRTLARRQATAVDIVAAAEPGKILHEVRRTASAAADLGLPATYYGTVDATPLWIVLLHEAWRAGMPDGEVSALLPAMRAALAWMGAAVERAPDGLLRYVDESGHGLSNQGWKDSNDSMRHADGSIASAPIALIEAQAYAVQAALAGAELLAAFGDGPGGWTDWAEALAARVRARFWVGDDDAYLAMALDADGRAVDGVGSNMGHALATGLLTPDETAVVVDRLLRADMLRSFGIGTLSRDNPAYNPIGYHTGSVWTHDTAIAVAGMAASGHLDAARQVAGRVLRLADATGYRLPELSGGETVGGRPVPYPAACRPQAWAAAAAVVILDVLG